MSDRDGRTRAAAFRESVTGSEIELPYAGLDTFLKADPRAIDDVGAVDAAVLGVPYDGAVSNRPGARYDPTERTAGLAAYLLVTLLERRFAE